MILELDDRTDAELVRFALRFACEDCVHFEAASGACSLGYPNEAHRDGAHRGSRRLVFCKEFEIA